MAFGKLAADLEVLAYAENPIITLNANLPAGRRLVRVTVNGATARLPYDAGAPPGVTITVLDILMEPAPSFEPERLGGQAMGSVLFTGAPTGSRVRFGENAGRQGDDDVMGGPYQSLAEAEENGGTILATLQSRAKGSSFNCPAGEVFWTFYEGGGPGDKLIGIAQPPGIIGGVDYSVPRWDVIQPTEFVAEIDGGEREIVVLVRSTYPQTLCGAAGSLAPAEYCWKAVLEDLGTP